MSLISSPILLRRTYKKQIEEAEEIAALNLAKFRQTQTALASASEAAGQAEQALAKAKAQAGGRAASIGPVSFLKMGGQVEEDGWLS
jgi:hypothetical protein